MKRAVRYQYFFSVILIAPNSINGDNGAPDIKRVISFLTDVVASDLRETDPIGHLGMGRLMAILPYTDPKRALQIRTRLMSHYSRFRLDNKDFQVQMSLSCFPKDANTPGGLIHVAESQIQNHE